MAKICPRKNFLMSSLFIDVTFNKSTVIGSFCMAEFDHLGFTNHSEQHEAILNGRLL